MPDEILNHLADTFLALQIRELLRIPFGKYIHNPEAYDRLAIALHTGNGLHIEEGKIKLVTLH
jgi:hypothetical protein